MTQKEALNILKLGYNVFLTGGPGTGKTFVLNKFINFLKVHNIEHSVTASTGIAATHIGGQTIHSFSGIGIKENLSERDLDSLSQKPNLDKRINKIKVLIIDEISMLSASTLDNIDKIFKTIRRNNQPFGGVQIVFCGDFFQLPPVIKFEKDQSFEDKSNNLLKQFAFKSESWKNSKPLICYLEKNFRQEDEGLANILNMIRSKDEDIYESLQSLYETIENSLDNPIRLYSHNTDVDSINTKYYEQIQSKEYIYKMKEKGDNKSIQNLKKNILALETLKLKVGTKVIFVKNDKLGKYQNGTLGVVCSFDEDNYPNIEVKNNKSHIKILNIREEVWQIKDDNDKIIAEIHQIPIRYAWAITIHKSQGMTLDQAEIDLSKGFGFGMGYVALSRVRSLSGLKLLGLNSLALSAANPVIEFDKILKINSKKVKQSISKYTQEDIELMHIKKIQQWGIQSEYYDEDQIQQIINSQEYTQDNDESFTKKEDTRITTLRLIFDNNSLIKISEQRDLKIETILDHVRDIKIMISSGDIDMGHNLQLFEKTIFDYYQEYIKENYKNKNLKESYKKLYFKNNINNNKLLLEIKDSLDNNTKLSVTYLKYKDQIQGLDWLTLKIIKII